jgi:hypothetical protein
MQDDDLSRLISFYNVFVRYCAHVYGCGRCFADVDEVGIKLSSQKKPCKILPIKVLRDCWRWKRVTVETNVFGIDTNSIYNYPFL